MIKKYEIPLSRFIREFRAWARRVSLSGNTIVIITRNGQPIAEMVPHKYQEEAGHIQLKQMNSTDIEKIFLLAVELFDGNEEKATAWFGKPNRALKGISPSERVKATDGVEAVKDLIGRLEHGIFS